LFSYRNQLDLAGEVQKTLQTVYDLLERTAGSIVNVPFLWTPKIKFFFKNEFSGDYTRAFLTGDIQIYNPIAPIAVNVRSIRWLFSQEVRYKFKSLTCLL
jgi:hypothetical protein